MMEPQGDGTTGDRPAHGQVRTEVVDDRILVMTVDRVEKKNAFTPKIADELAAAYTRLDDGDEQGGHGDHRLPGGDRVVPRTTPGTVHGSLT